MNSPIKSVYNATEASGIKATIYGRSGVGKTVLLSTAPAPLIISAENGLLSLRKIIKDRRQTVPNFDMPHIPIRSLADLKQTFSWLKTSKDARQFQTFGLDSVSELAEQILSTEKAKTRDPRQAYGALIDEVLSVFRDFRDFAGPNIVFLAKEEANKHGVTGAVRYSPSFPGQSVGPQTPYLFDEVFRLVVVKDTEGKDVRALLTNVDHESEAKDRSGYLAPLEYPDLTYVFKKILTGQ